MAIKDAVRYSKVRECCLKGARKLVQRLERDLWEDAPSFESMRPKCPGSYCCGGGVSSRPLQRFLKKSVGKLWVEVKDKIPSSQRENLQWLFRTDVVEGPEGFEDVRGYGSYSFFVDKGGVLREVGREYRKFRYEKKRTVTETVGGVWRGGKYVAEVVERFVFEGELFVLRGEFWFRRVVVGYRDVCRWDSELMRSVLVGREAVTRDLQVDGKTQALLCRESGLSKVPRERVLFGRSVSSGVLLVP